MALACGLLDLSLSYMNTERVCVRVCVSARRMPEPRCFRLSEGTFVQSDP